MAVRLSAPRTGRPLPPGRFLVLISVRSWGLGQLKNPMTSSWIESANLLAFSLVPKPTTLQFVGKRRRVLFVIAVFSLVSLFWKNNGVGSWDHVAVCVCLCILSYSFWMPEPIFMKLGTHITAPESISTHTHRQQCDLMSLLHFFKIGK
jgi:hypothetical protein